MMTALALDLPLLLTAALAGLLGSGHCFGMCGGIAGSLGALQPATTWGSRWAPGLIFNLGRILSYLVLGVLAALVLAGAGDLLHVPQWARVLRLATAIMIFLIGLRFLFGFSGLERLERAGAVLWRLVQPTAVRLSARAGVASRLFLGMCWGLLPCGLVYSILLTAASTASPTRAAWVMLAFGLGTLPSMLGLTWMSPMLGTLLRDPVVRRIVGLSLLGLAAWTLLMLSGPSAHGKVL
jgi:sulfite exporter TauE/SafE